MMTTAVRRVLASVLAWIVGATAAVGVGLLALSLIDDGLEARPVPPMPTDVVAHDASDAPSATNVVHAGPSTPARSSASARDRLVTSPGGTAVVRCGDTGAYLVTWSPEPGYRADDVRRGPDAQVSVTFEAGEHDIQLSARCVGGVPEPRVVRLNEEEHDHRGPG
jgi:hypothetical protein